jgi:hypothetical protein
VGVALAADLVLATANRASAAPGARHLSRWRTGHPHAADVTRPASGLAAGTRRLALRHGHRPLRPHLDRRRRRISALTITMPDGFSRCLVEAVADLPLPYLTPLDLSHTRVHTRTVTPDPKSVATAVDHVLGIGMSHLEEACRNIERAISKAAGYRQDILGCVVFLALGLCEVIDEWMSTIELVDSRYIQELLDCRAGRSQLPNGMERLSRQDADFVKLWCQGKVTIITWVDKYTDFAVS